MKLMKGIFYKVKKRKNKAYLIYFSIPVLFFTFIFQIFIIIRLNSIEKQLNSKVTTENNNIVISGVDDKSALLQESAQDTNIDSNETILNADSPEQESPFNREEFLSNALFIGDSRTESLQRFTDAGISSVFCCQVGANVNNIMDVEFIVNNESLNLFAAVGKYKFKNVLICLGINELGWKNDNAFINNYSELIDNIKTLSPDTNIYIIAITHIGMNAQIANEFENNDKINRYNELIEKMCSEKDITYIDVNSEFINEQGFLPDEYTTDGIHFKSEYNCIYLDKLIEAIEATQIK